MSSSNSPRVYPYLARLFHIDSTVTEQLVRASAASAAYTRLRPKMGRTVRRVEIGCHINGQFQSLFDVTVTQ